MKFQLHKIALCTALTILFTASSCHKALKDPKDYYPTIRMVSATLQMDGSVLVEGEIVSEGDAPLTYIGFCCGTMSKPEMLNRQLISSTMSGSHFTAVYAGTGFSVDSTYYFRAWACNGYGYSYGDIVSLDSIIATPVTPPCSLVMNMVNIGGTTPNDSYYDVTQPTVYMGMWEFDATGNNTDVHFKFGSNLTTGIYTTTSSTNPASGEVYVQFTNGSFGGVLNSGSSVYVNTVGSGVYEVTICSSPYVYSSTTLYFKTRLTVPY